LSIPPKPKLKARSGSPNATITRHPSHLKGLTSKIPHPRDGNRCSAMTRLGPIHLLATAYRSAGLFVFLEVPDPQDILIPIVPSCFTSARRQASLVTQPHTVPPPKSLKGRRKSRNAPEALSNLLAGFHAGLSYNHPLSRTTSKLDWESAVNSNSDKGVGRPQPHLGFAPLSTQGLNHPIRVLSNANMRPKTGRTSPRRHELHDTGGGESLTIVIVVL
jgi:hypothetical protein